MNISDIALGVLIGTVWWVFFLVYYFPRRMRRLKREIIEETPKILKKVGPTMFKSIKEDLESDKDNETKQFIAEASFFLVGAAMNIIEKDDHIKAWLRGFINSQAGTMFKSLETRAKSAMAEYGIDSGDGMEGEGVPDDMKKMFQLFQLFKQGKKIMGGP
jgi:hypothetical protein